MGNDDDAAATALQSRVAARAILADLTRGAAAFSTGQPVDLALQNGGGIRNELPAGKLTYGDLFEVLPFDNRLALVRMPGHALVELFRKNIQGSHGVLVPSGGFRIESRCDGSELKVDMFGPDGKPVDSDRIYAVAVSDFWRSAATTLAPSCQSFGPGSVQVFEDTMLREVIVGELQRYQGPFLSGSPQPHRLNLPMPRPVRCPPSNM